MTGQTIGHYRIAEKLGEGGMGVVYRAQDTRLGRPVAIKVLHPDAVANSERKRRFVQEARAASSLNHPNIITIYDIDEADGVEFLAMEYVAGRTLDRVAGNRGLALDEALRYAVQIADGLATAHEAGIVHRDLKPGNIMVTEKGQVKLLDFGLAKLTEPLQANDLTATLTQAPRTEEGVILGTVVYMSPEQAEGRKVDARSDIFSFGSVLYELVSGKRPFAAETKLSILSAILHQEPQPIGELVAGAPEELQRIITRCLRKDPGRRFQTMGDLKVALEELREESDSGRRAAGKQPPRSARRWFWAAGAAGAVALAGLALWWQTRRLPGEEPSQPAVRLTQDAGLAMDPALSPDGKWVVYASDRAGAGDLDIWIQNVASGESNRLTTDAADEREPVFSPDGGRIAFRSEKEGGGVYVVPTIGGQPRLVAREGRRPRFSPDGTTLAYYIGGTDPRTGLHFRTYVAPAGGGAPRQVAAELTVAGFPAWLPDGRHLVLLGGREDSNRGTRASVARGRIGFDWMVVATDAESGRAAPTGVYEVLRRAGFNLDSDSSQLPVPGEWVQDAMVFSGQRGDSENLWQIGLEPRTWQASGAPRQLTSGTSQEAQPSGVVVAGKTRLVFSSLSSTVNVWGLPIEANRGRVTGEPRQLTSAADDAQLSLSGDGRRLVFVSNRTGNKDIWLKDLESGRETAVVAAPGDQSGPAISADGKLVVYQAPGSRGWDFYLVALGGPEHAVQPAAPEKICADCLRLWDISQDGRTVLFLWVEPPNATLGLLDRTTGRKQEWLRGGEYGIVRVRFSPDNRWLSWIGALSAERSRVFVAPFREQTPPRPEEWVAITEADTFHDKPVWSPDGNLLYYTSDRDGFRCILARRLDPMTKRPVGPPLEVWHSHSARRSLLNVSILEQEIAVGPDKLVFHLGERRGNIWMK